MAAMARLSRIRRCNTISFASKFRFYKSLVTSTVLHGCETGTLLADSEKKEPGFRNQVHEETPPYLLLGKQDQRKGAEQNNFLVGRQELLLATFKRRKLAWFVRVTRHDSLSKTILHGNLGGWATPWSAEEMLDEQHQRVDIPAHARTAHKNLLQKRLEEDLC